MSPRNGRAMRSRRRVVVILWVTRGTAGQALRPSVMSVLGAGSKVGEAAGGAKPPRPGANDGDEPLALLADVPLRGGHAATRVRARAAAQAHPRALGVRQALPHRRPIGTSPRAFRARHAHATR